MQAKGVSEALAMRRSSLTISLIFHATCFVLAVVSFPWLKKDYDIPIPLSVEMVTIDEMNQTTKVAPKPEKKIEKKVEKPPAPPKPAPAATNTVKEMVKPTKDLIKEDPIKKDEKVLVDPTAHPDKKLDKQDEKKKKVTETEEQKFASILKNLQEEKPQPKDDQKPDLKLDEPAPPDEGRPVPLGERMTMTEMEAVRGQLAGCWTKMPAGAKEAQDLAVEVHMTITRERTLQAYRIVDQGRYNSDPFFRAVADSVKWALSDPNCSPLLLPPDKYDTWKSILITFDPSDMF